MDNCNEDGGLQWNDWYLLGNEKIDIQHRELFDFANALIRSCDEGVDKEKLKETLLFLVNYAVLHFDDEEALQIECKYPEYKAHKKMHDDFKVVVLDLVNRFSESGSSVELGNDVKKIIIMWLINHIMQEDKKIGEYLESRN